MAGQPQIAGVLDLDVTGLDVSAQTGIWAPTNIVATNEAFDLGAKFQGDGFVWGWLNNWAQQYRVTYFAEAIGNSTNDRLLGSCTNTLNGALSYGPPDTN